MTDEAPAFTEAARRPGKRKGDPDNVWQVAPAPFPSAEGHRIVWVHSSQKQRLDETARSERIQRARRDLADLGRRLAGPRARIGSLVAAEEAAAALLSATGAQRWVTVTVTEATTETIRQEKATCEVRPGRPGYCGAISRRALSSSATATPPMSWPACWPGRSTRRCCPA